MFRFRNIFERKTLYCSMNALRGLRVISRGKLIVPEAGIQLRKEIVPEEKGIWMEFAVRDIKPLLNGNTLTGDIEDVLLVCRNLYANLDEIDLIDQDIQLLMKRNPRHYTPFKRAVQYLRLKALWM